MPDSIPEEQQEEEGQGSTRGCPIAPMGALKVLNPIGAVGHPNVLM